MRQFLIGLFPLLVHSIYQEVDLRGDVWPAPDAITIDRSKAYKLSSDLTFVNSFTNDCGDIIADNIKRYQSLIKQPNFQYSGNSVKPGEPLDAEVSDFEIDSVKFQLTSQDSVCGYPQQNSIESYIKI